MKAVLFILALACWTYSAGANIIYTDVIPDTVISGVAATELAVYQIDLDRDGNSEFFIGQHHYGSSMDAVQFFCSQYGQSEALRDINGKPVPLERDAVIDANQSEWYNSQASSMDMSDYWSGSKDKYIGLRFNKNNNWYYGWLRVDVAQDVTSVTVKDFAFDNSPGKGIKAGDRGTANIENSTENKVNIILTGKSLVFELNPNVISAVVTFYDYQGREVISTTIDNTHNIFNLDGLTSGIYFCVLKVGTYQILKEFFIVR